MMVPMNFLAIINTSLQVVLVVLWLHCIHRNKSQEPLIITKILNKLFLQDFPKNDHMMVPMNFLAIINISLQAVLVLLWLHCIHRNKIILHLKQKLQLIKSKLLGMNFIRSHNYNVPSKSGHLLNLKFETSHVKALGLLELFTSKLSSI
jgi:hypothetical protein